MAKQKYYAVRSVGGKKVCKIYYTWDECKKIVDGAPAPVYKSFTKESEALAYINDYEEEPNEYEVLSNPDNVIYYVDGSYMNDTIGWGWIKVKNKEVIDKDCGAIKPSENTSRNITGELKAALSAVKNAIMTGEDSIYIVNDYQGISSFANGSWKPNSEHSKAYARKMKQAMSLIDIKFIKVKGHTGNKFNEMVDKVAKEGTTRC